VILRVRIVGIHYLKKNNGKLSSSERFNLLVKIAQGLKDIHQKNLVHRDFHSGNILKGIEQTSCLIIDLGLCKPVDQITQEEKIFGVLPYVAPEVLTGQPYTQASDIYSFAIVASELLTGLPPYYDKSHDVKLGIAICQKLRPSFNIKIPQLLMELIKRC
jgi:serine/threonine protein kinase